MNELTPAQLEWARKLVRTELARGTPRGDIDAALKRVLGVGIADVSNAQSGTSATTPPRRAGAPAQRSGTISPEQLTGARRGIRAARAQGVSDEEIDSYLREQLGVGIEYALAPTNRDFWRTVGGGITLGHLDEITGGISAMLGGDYSTTRNKMRAEDEEFVAARPGLSLGTQVAAGALPALATALVPGLGPSATGGWAANALRAAALAGATGAVAGEGMSRAPKLRDVAKDAATSAALSAAAGGALSTAGSVARWGVGGMADALSPGRPIVREAATQLPPNAAATIARQETLAPGTAAPADLSPEMRALTRGVGADAQTGVAARRAAESRLARINDARADVGARYNALNRPLPVDADLRDILARAGRKQILGKAATEVDFSALHSLRSNLLAEARATRNSAVRFDKNAQAAKLTAWLSQHTPELEQVDSDYAFLTRSANAAKQTLKEITNSSKNYAAARAYGADAGSIGGSLPSGARGVFGKVVDAVLTPDRAARARAANELLLKAGPSAQQSVVRFTSAKPSAARRRFGG